MAEPVRERYVESSENQHDSPEELENQVQRAQEQLLQLKRQQEMIERQKRELEELSRKQEELERGRAEMIEKLNRSVGVIDRETYEAEKRVEQLRATRATFLQHLDVLEQINPKDWNHADLHKELSKALSSVDDARTEYNKSAGKINANSGEDIIRPVTTTGDDDVMESGAVNFALWLKRGLAFTLPLILFGIIALVIALCFR